MEGPFMIWQGKRLADKFGHRICLSWGSRKPRPNSVNKCSKDAKVGGKKYETCPSPCHDPYEIRYHTEFFKPGRTFLIAEIAISFSWAVPTDTRIYRSNP